MRPTQRRATMGAGRAVVPRGSGSYSNTSAAAAQGARRFSGGVVLIFIFMCTVLSLYDLLLLLKLLGK